MSSRTVEAVWRMEAARIVGALARYTGEFASAEDFAQQALSEALALWPRDGVRPNPRAWLLTVAADGRSTRSAAVQSSKTATPRWRAA